MREAHRAGESPQRRWGGSIFALSAGALLLLSIFMPELHCETIDLQENKLIDNWEGVALIGCAALIVIGALLGLRRRLWGWLGCAAGAVALGLAIYSGSGSRLIVLKGVAGLQGDVYAVPGIGLLVAGLAAVVAIGAGLAISLREYRI